ncbi:MAG: response regulator [Chloroflexota bacterium]
MSRQILIVDDHEALREAMKTWITGLYPDIEVFQASDGEGAVELCQQEYFDLVLLDLGLPGMSGFEAIAEIKKYHPNIPIAVVTINEGSLFEQRALESGADEFITKRTVYTRLPDILDSYLC